MPKNFPRYQSQDDSGDIPALQRLLLGLYIKCLAQLKVAIAPTAYMYNDSLTAERFVRGQLGRIGEMQNNECRMQNKDQFLCSAFIIYSCVVGLVAGVFPGDCNSLTSVGVDSTSTRRFRVCESGS
jgi:hypothetical protein